ncbi:MAG: PAS domain S-box protein [Desulfomonilaceae bacterium]|nr:PAS domain S-box protein [Desulfomonilaceae bacterium]
MNDEPTRFPSWLKCALPIATLALLVLGSGFLRDAPAQSEGAEKGRSVQAPSSIPIISTLTEDELSWLREHPVIRVVQDPGWPPVEFADEHGNFSGIAGDYLNLIEQRLGVKFERVRNLPWQEAYSRLKRWDIDMTTCVAVTEERTEFWAFTKPYLEIPIVVLTRSDVTYIGGMQELHGKRVAVVDGYVAKEWISRDFPDIQLVGVTSVKEGLDLLRKDEVFAFVDNMLVIGYYLARLKSADFKVAGTTPYVNAQRMAVRKDWAILAGILQKALDSISEAERARIYHKWVPIRYEHGYDYGRLGVMAAIFVLVLAGVLIWNRKLSREIVSRQQAEAALRESDQRHRTILKTAMDGFWMADMEGRILEVNDAYCRMIGYSREELLGMAVSALDVAEYRETVEERYKKIIHEGTQRFETRHRRRDGTTVQLDVSAQLLHGTERRVFLFLRDITARKKAEQDLRESEERYRTLVENLNDVIFSTDHNGIITYASPALERKSKYMRAEVVGRPFTDFVPPDDVAKIADRFVRLTEGEVEASEYRFTDKDGGIIHVSAYSRPVFRDGNFVGLTGLLTDITERRQAEQAIRDSENDLRSIFNAISESVALIKTNGEIVAANESFAARFGCREREVLGTCIYDYFPSDVAEGRKRMVNEVVRTGRPLRSEDEREGRAFFHALYPVMNQTGSVERIAVYSADVTDRKQAERALAESEQRFRTVIERSPVAVAFARDLKTIYVNPKYVEMFGYEKPKELLGTPITERVSPRFILEFTRRALHREQGLPAESNYSIEGLRKDGTTVPIQASVTRVNLADGPATVGFFVDVTELKRAEEDRSRLQAQLLQAQKMEAVGTLAGGIAHDFNNILQVVLGYSDLVLTDKAPDDPDYDDLNTIRRAARNGADLVKQILTVSRKAEISPHPMDLNREVRNAEQLLRRTLPRIIELEILLGDDLWRVNADPGQMEQMLLNLAVNAKDAMPRGGRIVIETENVRLEEDYCKSHLGVRPGDYVLLTFSDTGVGIYPEVLDHIFEPFFTTKKPGEGTGLGLAMVYGIVKQHEGHITCYSEPEQGTTFKIYLPAGKTEDVETTGQVRALPAGGAETILLVDDEDLVRELGKRILSGAGYTVFTAANGKEAVELYREKFQEIGLVVLDLIMPVMEGHECLRELLKIDPQAKVVVASGHSADGPARKVIKSGAKGFIRKPYDIRQVLDVVRTVLDAQ